MIFKIIKKITNRSVWLKDGICSFYAKHFLRAPHIMSASDTIDYIVRNRCSISRNGDGELNIMAGRDIPFQNYDARLSKLMHEAANYRADNYLSCMPDVFDNFKNLNNKAVTYYRHHLHKNRYKWLTYFKSAIYGNAFVTRPYIDLIDKSTAPNHFQHLREIWDNKNVIIIEGEKSRLGVGNDLFDNMKSIKRILVPATNAFERYDDIMEYISSNIHKDDLILLAMGPTATAMAYELCKAGFWALDIGHVDIEYEWMKMGATEKVPIKNKYTNEAQNGTNIGNSVDDTYINQIIAKFI